MKRFGLRTKLILIVAGALILAISVSVFMIRDLFYQNLLDQKMTTTDILTASIVHDIKYNFEVRDTIHTEDIIRKYITYYRIIKGISFYDTNLLNKIDSNPERLGRVTHDPDIIAALSLAKPSLKIVQFDKAHLGIRSISPILRGSRITGAVVMDVSIEDIETYLSVINRNIGMILIITVLVASLALFIMFRSSILIRLDRLMKVIQEIAAGNYKIRLDDAGQDEIGQLSQAFNQMAADLQKSKQELEDYHAKNLEQKIQELRTAYRDLKNAQSQLVLNEKMASLGTLVAGIAHEINTPLGAISNVSRNVERKIDSLPRLLEIFKKDTAISVDVMCACLKDIIQSSQRIDYLLSYKETQAIEKFLRAQGIKNWREMANALANLNFTDVHKITSYISCFKNPDFFNLLESISSIAQAAKISETSCNKIQEIVLALKYYAYTDKAKAEMIQISDSIYTALVLFRNKLKYKIRVLTKLDEDIPLISCTSEIHQVWTNLLSNAYDAIEQMGADYAGEISICSRKASDQVLITIMDNGVGIPEDKLENIFDPFFTTKDIGKGTGLGLSIVSGIIKKHNGAIGVKSPRNPTIFEISFPLETTPAYKYDRRESSGDSHEEGRRQHPTMAQVV